MLELVNQFFTSTYEYNHLFYEVRLLSVMLLAGTGLGLLGRCSPPGARRKNAR
ncbi:MAG: hypothetical protein K6T80_04125 [Firmicutes bacterium]|nr:hypothetical protein [Bacillota bacterium]